jgi:hypothetical protein
MPQLRRAYAQAQRTAARTAFRSMRRRNAAALTNVCFEKCGNAALGEAYGQVWAGSDDGKRVDVVWRGVLAQVFQTVSALS